MTKLEKKPRGRPPFGAVLVDGRWELTQESIAHAAKKLLQARQQQRERGALVRDLFRQQYPELFRQKKPLSPGGVKRPRHLPTARSTTKKSSDPNRADGASASDGTAGTLLQWCDASCSLRHETPAE